LFNFYWGPIHAASTGYDVLIVDGMQSVTGPDLVAVGSALSPPVNGNTPTLPNDNQWFNISDNLQPIRFFTATSSFDPAFSFDMAVPEPSTWAMMLLGFAGLGFAGYRLGVKAS
jgi:PEP-CTERM motif